MNRELVELREVVQKLVPLLAGKGLKVTQRGSQAYVATDTRTRKPVSVNIPNIPDTASEGFVLAIQGFIDHEIGHVLVTDWDHYGGAPSAADLRKPEVQRFLNLHNIIEDTMIEREIVKIFPGSRKNLSNVRKHFLDKITTPALAAAKDEREAFAYLMVPMFRALAGHTEMEEFMDEGGHWAQPYVKALLDKLSKDFLNTLKTCTTTKETYALSRELEKILHEPQKEEEKPEPQKGKSQDKPEKKAGEGNGDGEREHSESEPGEGEASKDDKATEGKGKKSKAEKPEQEEEESEDGGRGDTDAEDEPEDAEGDAEGKKPEDGDDDGDAGDEGDAGADGDDADDAEADEGDRDADGDDTADADEGPAAGDDDDAGDDDAGDGSGEDEGDDLSEGENGDEEKEDTGKEADQGKSDKGESDGDSGDVSLNAEKGEQKGFGDYDEDDDGDHGPGGGVGSGVSKSIFEFDADAFEKADLSSAISELISKEAVEALDNADYTVFSREADRIEPVEVPEKMDERWVPEMDEETQHMAGRMQKDIERIMASQSHVVRTPGHRTGKLHAPSLYRVPQGDPRVFTQKQEHVSKDTAVSLLCDNSGSMHGKKMRLAMIAAYALSQTLERVKITHEVLGFTTGNWGSMPRSLSEAMKKDYDASGVVYDRVIPLVIPIYKSFDERVTPEVKRRIAYMMNAQRGLAGNIDGESLQIAAERLVKRTEKRKVMLVLSDGQPAGGASSGPHLKGVVRDLNKSGIETIGIGILDASVSHYYDNYVVLNRAEDLPGEVMTEIKKILIN